MRSTPLSSILKYRHDASHAARVVDKKPFAFNQISITTSGWWAFEGSRQRADIDSKSLIAGVAGSSYGCRHFEDCTSLVLALRDGAVDRDYPPLFSKEIVSSGSALHMAHGALRTSDADAFDSLVFSLFDEVSAASKPGRGNTGRLRMQRAKRFIEFHAFERVGLCDIARELGLSPFTTVRQFRAATGHTPYAYILEIRLQRAKQLLTHDPRPIGSVATSIGFDDPAYFSRWFASKTGLSPLSYRAATC